MAELVVLQRMPHHGGDLQTWWYLAWETKTGGSSASYDYDKIPKPNRYDTEEQAIEARDALKKNPGFALYVPHVETVEKHEVRVTCKLNQGELESLLVKAVKEMSGIAMDRNTRTECCWLNDPDGGVAITIFNELKCGRQHG